MQRDDGQFPKKRKQPDTINNDNNAKKPKRIITKVDIYGREFPENTPNIELYNKSPWKHSLRLLNSVSGNYLFHDLNTNTIVELTEAQINDKWQNDSHTHFANYPHLQYLTNKSFYCLSQEVIKMGLALNPISEAQYKDRKLMHDFGGDETPYARNKSRADAVTFVMIDYDNLMKKNKASERKAAQENIQSAKINILEINQEKAKSSIVDQNASQSAQPFASVINTAPMTTSATASTPTVSQPSQEGFFSQSSTASTSSPTKMTSTWDELSHHIAKEHKFPKKQ